MPDPAGMAALSVRSADRWLLTKLPFLPMIRPRLSRSGLIVLDRGRWEGMHDLARRLFEQGQVREGLSAEETVELL
jgi:hypothetical protein